MASSQSIAPFPAEIDRDHFASWLSGFVDGEGCFRLSSSIRKVSPLVCVNSACLMINLRSDDRGALELIRSYFGCGHIKMRIMAGVHSQAFFCISRTRDLATIVIPHFERFPQFAKKRRDFEVWKQGVALLYRIWQRPRVCKQGKGVGAGAADKWTPGEREEFGRLRDALKDVRRFDEPGPIPEPKPRPDPSPQLTLFGP